ncbi:hypothetical protein BH11PLA1_BH11PLA1_14770 [soil metagenome]
MRISAPGRGLSSFLIGVIGIACLPYVLAAGVEAAATSVPAAAPPVTPMPSGAAPDEHEQKKEVVARRFDPASGRDLRRWAPAVEFDQINLRVALRVDDVTKQHLLCAATLNAKCVGSARRVMTLDARKTITIGAVRAGVAGRAVGCTFTHADDKFAITFGREIARDEEVEVEIDYEVNGPFPDGVGLSFVAGDPDSGAAPMIYSQGEANWNSCWLPIHDYPNDRLTTEMVITVPEGFTALGNGDLVGVPATSRGMTTFAYRMARPYASYLIALAIGKFEKVEIDPGNGPRGAARCEVYGPVGKAEDLRRLFGRTPAMMAFLEKLTGAPFAWGGVYKQVVVREFHWGGMENTGLTVMSDKIMGDDEAKADELIVHELGHHWFGDNITCRAWEHIWLTEGWATYIEALWSDLREMKTPGGEGATSAFGMAGRDVEHWRSEVIEHCRGTAPGAQPMVTKVYLEPDDLFERAEDCYNRGALVLHALRQRLGSEVFFRGVREYVKRFAFRAAETADFRRVMEEVSGESLERFFHQYCERPGVPRVTITPTWDAAAGTLEVAAVQTQAIDAENPAYEMDLHFAGIAPTLHTDSTRGVMTVKMDAKPRVLKFAQGMAPALAEYHIEAVR